MFPIALANLVLHGIDQPNLWHGNTLSGAPTYEALFEQAPATFDVILTNPPFGGKEGKDAQKNYSFETSSTQVLFMQHILADLKPSLDGKPGGRCAVVLDEGLLFLIKGKKTERIWYYDLSHVKVSKKTPMTLSQFGWGPQFEILDDPALPATLVGDWHAQEGNAGKPFPTLARLLAQRGTPEASSDFSWTVNFTARRAKARADMAPYLAEVERLKNQSVALKEKLGALKKANGNEKKMLACREELLSTEKSGREAQAKADAIDATTFDLKAVNPRTKVERDTRKPSEILDAIAAHGRTVESALKRLRALTHEARPPA